MAVLSYSYFIFFFLVPMLYTNHGVGRHKTFDRESLVTYLRQMR